MRIVLIGYGKMGRAIERLAVEKGHTIAGKIDIDTSSSDRKEILDKGDVAIEFSHPDAAFANILEALQNDIAVISGTTGWLSKFDKIKDTVQQRNGAFFYASNFSIGVNIMFAVNAHLARIMNRYDSYEVSVDEIHHVHKKDAPSGTALTLTNEIISNLDRKNSWDLETSDEESVKINAFRKGEVYGTHRVRYQSDIDTIELYHDAHTRDGFALGAIMAAQWLVSERRTGVFSMKEMMGL